MTEVEVAVLEGIVERLKLAPDSPDLWEQVGLLAASAKAHIGRPLVIRLLRTEFDALWPEKTQA